MELTGQEVGLSRYYLYKAEVYPRLWGISQNKDFRGFQKQTVPDIFKHVLENYNITIEDHIQGNYY